MSEIDATTRALLEGLYDALAAGERPAITAVLADDFVGRLTPGLPFGIGGEHVGAEAMIRDGWFAIGAHWRVRAEPASYTLLEDGIPVWLRSEVELIVSGKSREEELGTILPAGWKLASIASGLLATGPSGAALPFAGTAKKSSGQGWLRRHCSRVAGRAASCVRDPAGPARPGPRRPNAAPAARSAAPGVAADRRGARPSSVLHQQAAGSSQQSAA